jgi:hypothetical protein
MSEINQNYDCFPDCWEYNEPYALQLFMKKATKLLNETGSLEELRIGDTSFYFIEIDINILGNYGVYEETFGYHFTKQAEDLIKSYEFNKKSL